MKTLPSSEPLKEDHQPASLLPLAYYNSSSAQLLPACKLQTTARKNSGLQQGRTPSRTGPLTITTRVPPVIQQFMWPSLWISTSNANKSVKWWIQRMASAFTTYLGWSFQCFPVQVHHKMREWSAFIMSFVVVRYHLKQRKIIKTKNWRKNCMQCLK
jgi:hypothetical protein